MPAPALLIDLQRRFTRTLPPLTGEEGERAVSDSLRGCPLQCLRSGVRGGVFPLPPLLISLTPQSVRSLPAATLSRTESRPIRGRSPGSGRSAAGHAASTGIAEAVEMSQVNVRLHSEKGAG